MWSQREICEAEVESIAEEAERRVLSICEALLASAGFGEH